jgi:hypothetical protein
MNKYPLARKVGEVGEEEDKFLSWSGNHGYYSRPETNVNPFKTDKMMNAGFDVEAMVHNQTLCSSLREANKSTVEFKVKLTHDPKMLSTTSSQANFVDQKNMTSIMLERATSERLQAAFDDMFDKTETGLALTRGEFYAISTKYVAEIVNNCMGMDTPNFIVDKFVELSTKNSVGGKISWAKFSEQIPIVENAVSAECRFRRELPALMVLMNRPRIQDKKLGSLGNMSSTYRDNFNKTKELSFADTYPGFAYTKATEPTNKRGLNNAAKVLYAGTTKSTYHLPGFKGHIPANVRNTRKLEHSCGETYHPVANNLRLTQRGMGCVLGYTGHVPHETSGPRQERTTACDMRTTNGASYCGTRNFL